MEPLIPACGTFRFHGNTAVDGTTFFAPPCPRFPWTRALDYVVFPWSVTFHFRPSSSREGKRWGREGGRGETEVWHALHGVPVSWRRHVQLYSRVRSPCPVSVTACAPDGATIRFASVRDVDTLGPQYAIDACRATAYHSRNLGQACGSGIVRKRRRRRWHVGI